MRRRKAEEHLHDDLTPALAVHAQAEQRRAGQPSSLRALAQAIFVLAILSAKSSPKTFASSSGGPDSIMLLSGKPWLRSWAKLLECYY